MLCVNKIKNEYNSIANGRQQCLTFACQLDDENESQSDWGEYPISIFTPSMNINWFTTKCELCQCFEPCMGNSVTPSRQTTEHSTQGAINYLKNWCQIQSAFESKYTVESDGLCANWKKKKKFRTNATPEPGTISIVQFNICRGINSTHTQCYSVGMSVLCKMHANNRIQYRKQIKKTNKTKTRTQNRTIPIHLWSQTIADGNIT